MVTKRFVHKNRQCQLYQEVCVDPEHFVMDSQLVLVESVDLALHEVEAVVEGQPTYEN